MPGYDPISYSKIVTVIPTAANIVLFDPAYVTFYISIIMGLTGLVTMVRISSLLRLDMQRARDCMVTLHGMWTTTLLTGLFQTQVIN